MKDKKTYKFLLSFIFLSLFLPNLSFAVESCSENGYTILTVNGVFTNETGAKKNSDALKYYFGDDYNNEKAHLLSI